jgi:hypothetical protein
VLDFNNFPKNRVIMFLLLAIVAGCASTGRVQTPEIKPLKLSELPEGHGWWYARFQMHWPPDLDPVWYMDLYLAHQIILPKLRQNRADIDLWRFHRRAGRDGHGRQFSFVFYSSPLTAQRIFNSLRNDPLVDNLKSAGILSQVVYDDPSRIKRPNIEDTSDESWPEVIQKTWPYYIMGASEMWLNLITEIAAQKLTDSPPASIGEIETFYQQVNETVTELWRTKGRHAFMHHLNAIFEYEALIYYEKKYLTF